MKRLSSLLFAALAAFISLSQADETPACCSTQTPGVAIQDIVLSSKSLFHLESQWQNRKGITAPLAQLHGKTQIVAMMYTKCKYACPRIIADLKMIESSLNAEELQQVSICLITIDPERDTVEHFNQYAAKQNLDPQRWSFLRGSQGDTLELANLLGVKYKELPDGDFSHSNIITLLNAKGEIVYQLNGLGADPTHFILQTKSLLKSVDS